jgi:replicative DNA helicase Mcm
LASARARILLRDQVIEDDALAAISLMNRMVEDVLTDTETKTRADFGVLLGKPTGERNKRVVAMDVFKTLEGADKKPVERKALKEELMKTGRFNDEDAEKMIQNLIRDGTIYESPKPGFYRRLQS